LWLHEKNNEKYIQKQINAAFQHRLKFFEEMQKFKRELHDVVTTEKLEELCLQHVGSESGQNVPKSENNHFSQNHSSQDDSSHPQSQFPYNNNTRSNPKQTQKSSNFVRFIADFIPHYDDRERKLLALQQGVYKQGGVDFADFNTDYVTKEATNSHFSNPNLFFPDLKKIIHTFPQNMFLSQQFNFLALPRKVITFIPFKYGPGDVMGACMGYISGKR